MKVDLYYLTQTLARLGRFAATPSQTMSWLSCIALTASAEGLTLVATNRYAWGMATLARQPEDQQGAEWTALLSWQAWHAIIKVFGSVRYRDIVAAELQAGDVDFTIAAAPPTKDGTNPMTRLTFAMPHYPVSWFGKAADLRETASPVQADVLVNLRWLRQLPSAQGLPAHLLVSQPREDGHQRPIRVTYDDKIRGAAWECFVMPVRP